MKILGFPHYFFFSCVYVCFYVYLFICVFFSSSLFLSFGGLGVGMGWFGVALNAKKASPVVCIAHHCGAN